MPLTFFLFRFNFLFWNNLKLTKKLQKHYEGLLCTLHPDPLIVNMLLHLLYFSLSFFVCRVCTLLCYVFHESFASKLSTSCLFIPKHFSVHFLMGKTFHSDTMLVPTPGNLMLIQYCIQGPSPGTSSRSCITVSWPVPLVPFIWNSSLVFEGRHFWSMQVNYFAEYSSFLVCSSFLITSLRLGTWGRNATLMILCPSIRQEAHDITLSYYSWYEHKSLS